MLWGKKSKSNELPELPPMPAPTETRVEEVQEVEETQELPSFPDSAEERGFSQSAIKEAVYEGEMPELPEETVETVEEAPARRSNDVFVKVDRFVAARKALETAHAKVDEMQELLKVIRETKLREEQELAYWEKEVASAKSHVQQVTENIFGKIE